MIENVYIRERPGDNDRINDSMLIDVCDSIRAGGKYVITRKDEIDNKTLILALGGDGTMLSAIHLAAETHAYVTGFNYGNLGYLVPGVATSVKGLTSQLAVLMHDINSINKDDIDYKVTSLRLPVLCWDNNPAINDFSFVPASNGSAADFKIAIGKDDSFFNLKSSGVVLSTPLGSTGLALSAGGSIISPDSHVLEVVPLLPHTLTSRPIIFPDSDKVVVSWDRKVNVIADGRLIDGFGQGEVAITCKKRKINLIQPAAWDFFENLKNKMKWHT